MRALGRVVSLLSASLALALSVPSPSHAQMRVAPAEFGHSVAHAVRVAPPAHSVAVPRARVITAIPSPPHARAFISPARSFTNSFLGGSGETLQQLLDPFPGPGFDYAHLAALDRDLAIKAVIDPETQWRLAVAERVLRSTGGFATSGYYLLDGGGEYVMPAEQTTYEQPQQSQPPQIIVLQQPAERSAAESAPAAPQTTAPVPDVGNFTLVLANGTKIEAIAFTRSGNRIIYITADGERHSIAASELDNAATERVNQERGTQLTL